MIGALVIAASVVTLAAGGGRAAQAGAEGQIRSFLRHYLGPEELAWRGTSFAWAKVDAAGAGGDETVVYLMGDPWCGSSGCTLLVLARTAGSYRVIGRTTAVKLPIRALATESHGRRDLGVLVQGGGVVKGYEAELRFDGSQYPPNATVPPAKAIRGGNRGAILIPANPTAVGLYQDGDAIPRTGWE